MFADITGDVQNLISQINNGNIMRADVIESKKKLEKDIQGILWDQSYKTQSLVGLVNNMKPKGSTKQYKGIIHIENNVLNDLQEKGLLKECTGKPNNYYTILAGGGGLALIEVRKDNLSFFKIISEESVFRLSTEKWVYDERDIKNSSTGQTMEQFLMTGMIGCTGKRKPDYEIHHAWFRFCAIPFVTIALCKKQLHKELHSKAISSARRHQSILIRGKGDFEILIGETEKIIHTLLFRKCCIKY